MQKVHVLISINNDANIWIRQDLNKTSHLTYLLPQFKIKGMATELFNTLVHNAARHLHSTFWATQKCQMFLLGYSNCKINALHSEKCIFYDRLINE